MSGETFKVEGVIDKCLKLKPHKFSQNEVKCWFEFKGMLSNDTLKDPTRFSKCVTKWLLMRVVLYSCLEDGRWTLLQ